jgi:hypothetical protein
VRLLAAALVVAATACKREIPAARDTVRRTPVPLAQQRAGSDSVENLSPVQAGTIARAESNACDTATMILREAVSLKPHRQEGFFKDSFSSIPRVGCRLTAVGSFKALEKLGNHPGPVDIVVRAFLAHGWGMDVRHQADGPDGSDVGVRRLETLCLVMGHWDGGDDSDTTKHAPTPEEDQFDVVIECVHDMVLNSDAAVPDSIWRIAAAAGLDSTYAISFRIQSPPYVQGDFDGDGSRDAAVLVEQRMTGKLGIAFVYPSKKHVSVAGAGNAIDGLTDDLSWVDGWEVYSKGTVVSATMPHRMPSSLPGDALLLTHGESASAFLFWNGTAYAGSREPRRP